LARSQTGKCVLFLIFALRDTFKARAACPCMVDCSCPLATLASMELATTKRYKYSSDERTNLRTIVLNMRILMLIPCIPASGCVSLLSAPPELRQGPSRAKACSDHSAKHFLIISNRSANHFWSPRAIDPNLLIKSNWSICFMQKQIEM